MERLDSGALLEEDKLPKGCWEALLFVLLLFFALRITIDVWIPIYVMMDVHPDSGSRMPAWIFFRQVYIYGWFLVVAYILARLFIFRWMASPILRFLASGLVAVFVWQIANVYDFNSTAPRMLERAATRGLPYYPLSERGDRSAEQGGAGQAATGEESAPE